MCVLCVCPLSRGASSSASLALRFVSIPWLAPHLWATICLCKPYLPSGARISARTQRTRRHLNRQTPLALFTHCTHPLSRTRASIPRRGTKNIPPPPPKSQARHDGIRRGRGGQGQGRVADRLAEREDRRLPHGVHREYGVRDRRGDTAAADAREPCRMQRPNARGGACGAVLPPRSRRRRAKVAARCWARARSCGAFAPQAASERQRPPRAVRPRVF